ncbi:hypothetical protein D3C73_1097490 [compost metagenome]
MYLTPANICGYPLTGDGLEGIAVFSRLLVLLFLYTGIGTCAQYRTGFLAQYTGRCQRDGRVSAKRQFFLFSAKAVFKVPEFGTVGFNQQV